MFVLISLGMLQFSISGLSFEDVWGADMAAVGTDLTEMEEVSRLEVGCGLRHP